MTLDTLPASSAQAGPVRVSVTSGHRRVDLVLPGATPVAELAPELALGAGLLDHGSAHLGAHLLSAEGVVLTGGLGLRAQGVCDGAVLAVVTGRQEASGPLYDDVAEAVADAVEQTPTWTRRARQHTARVVAGLALALGAAAVAATTGASRPVAGLGALALAVVLIGVAALLSRVAHDPPSALTAALGGVGHAAVAGVVLAPGDGSVVGALPAGGVGGVVAALVALAALGPGRLLLLAPVLAGSVVLGLSAATRLTGADAAVVACCLLTAVVVLLGSVPRMALAVTGLRAGRLGEPGSRIDGARVRDDARLAVELVVAFTAAAGLLLVVLGLVVVERGPAGAVLAGVACLVVLVGSRQHRARAAVLVGVVCAAAGLVVLGAVLVVQLDSWRPVLAAVAGLAGLAGLAATLVPEGGLGRSRAVGAVEIVLLVALLPLTVWAGGLLETFGR